MRTALPLLAAALAAAPLSAQLDHKIVFPLSLTHREGGSADTLLMNQPYIRWQQVDGDSLNNPHIVKFVRLRRDGLQTSPTAKNRVVDVEMSMGGGLLQIFGNDFGSNWLPGTKTKVMNRKSINLPDYTQLPPSPPAAFDLTLPVDFVWAHTGFVHLVFEMQVWDNGAGPGTYVLDAASVTGSSAATSTALGLGCTTNTGVFTDVSSFGVSSFGASFSMTLAATGAPASTPVTYLLGSSDPNLALGWCTALRVAPTLGVTIGTASAGGAVSTTFNASNYNPAWWGLPLFVQAVALDASQPGVPLAFSNGRVLVLPPNPFDVQYIYATSPASLTGQGPTPGGVIIEISDTN